MPDNLLFPPVNEILAALPQDEFQRLTANSDFVWLSVGKVLYETLDEIKTVFFPCSAIVSLVSILENGSSTEVSIVGNSSMLGLSVILGEGISFNRAFVQVAGSAIKISTDTLKREFARKGMLHELLMLCVEFRINEVSQLAVCNRHHTIEQRLAYWLLRLKDLIQSDEIFLTQEFIAKMLGVRRASVTVAAQALQQVGAIGYSRGNIIILDLNTLKNKSCECYEFQKAVFCRSLGLKSKSKICLGS